MLQEYIKPVELQIILDDGTERYVPAILNISTGDVMAQHYEKKKMSGRIRYHLSLGEAV